jgi:hypothetical protein
MPQTDAPRPVCPKGEHRWNSQDRCWECGAGRPRKRRRARVRAQKQPMSRSQRRRQTNRRPGPLKTRWLTAPATTTADTASEIEPALPVVLSTGATVEAGSSSRLRRYRPSTELPVGDRGRKRNDYDGRYRISFFEDGKRVFHLALLTPAADIWNCVMYEQAIVGFDAEGRPIRANWIDDDAEFELRPKSMPALRRFRDPPEPRARTLAVGVLLTETDTGRFEMAHDQIPDALGELRPRVGLIVQGVRNFWMPLLNAAPTPDGRLFRVKKLGAKINRHFTFDDIGPCPAVNLAPGNLIDLDAYVEEIADRQRLRRLLDDLPANWQFY